MDKVKLACILLFLTGCSSLPLDDNLPLIVECDFNKSPTNKYAVLSYSRLYDNKLDFIRDEYVQNDINQLAKLLTHKGYSVYITYDLRGLEECLINIGKASDDNTKTFFAYSGEGDSKGLRLIGQYVSERRSQLIIPPNVTITPKWLIDICGYIKGEKALVINACESGVFAHYAEDNNFNGVVIAACDVGAKTTPHEYKKTTALFSTFLSHYSDDINAVWNLPDMDIGTVGGWWYNFMHIMSNKFTYGSNIKLSYDSVMYAKGNFKL